jgi:hypothetical protein
MRIIGRDTMSERMAASMIDVEASLPSWPQLASEVALGAALNVDTARRVALGELTRSGRFTVDLQEHVSDARAVPVEAPRDPRIEPVEAPRLPPLAEVRGAPGPDDVATLIAWATTAFSGGNCQPWTFRWQGGRLVLVHDADRSRTFLDVDSRASFLAFGSVIETLVLAAPAMGLEARPRLFPDPSDLRRVADVELAPASAARDPLLACVPDRVTNRRLGARRPLDPGHRARMEAAAAVHGGRVRWLEDPRQLDAIASVLGGSDRIRFLSAGMHAEMMAELRWSTDEVERTRDGLDLATLELSASDLAGMQVIRKWPVMRTLARTGGGLGLERPTRKAIAASAAVGLLTVDGRDPASFVRAGRALHRLWLTATADGVALQPMTSVTYLFHRLLHAGGAGLAQHEADALAALRRRYLELFPVGAGEAEPMLFRVGYADPPTARSLRRPVEDVLRIAG